MAFYTLDNVKDDIAAMRRMLRRKKRLDELKAGKPLERHQENIALIRETRDFKRFGDAHAKIPDLYALEPAVPPPGVPDSEIENYGPDGTFLRKGL